MTITEKANLKHAKIALDMLKIAIRIKDINGVKSAKEYCKKYVSWDSYNTLGLDDIYDEWEGELEDADNLF